MKSCQAEGKGKNKRSEKPEQTSETPAKPCPRVPAGTRPRIWDRIWIGSAQPLPSPSRRVVSAGFPSRGETGFKSRWKTLHGNPECCRGFIHPSSWCFLPKFSSGTCCSSLAPGSRALGASEWERGNGRRFGSRSGAVRMGWVGKDLKAIQGHLP